MLHIMLRGALLVSLSSLALAAPTWTSWSGPPTSPKAIYFLTDDTSNSVVALPVASDGTLSTGALTATGGQGAVGINGALNAPQDPDPLYSQSALTRVGNYIFAVNAGSNTVSMLSIDPAHPTKLTLVGKPVAVPGQFPNTVAASAENKLVCVGTTGVANGISCSSYSAKGLGPMDGLRSFGLNQTTPPVGPTNTGSQVFFSEDESRLYAVVKGDPTVNNTGFFSVYPVEQARKGPATLSAQGVQSSFAGTAVLFGSQNIPGTSSVFATDASFGAVVIDVDPSTNEASLAAKEVIANQSASCWSTISPATGSAFIGDAGLDRLVEMSLTDASILSITDLSADGDAGLIDLAAAGNFIYALAPGNGSAPVAVAVIDVSGGQGSAKLLQHFQVENTAVGKTAQGMAVFQS